MIYLISNLIDSLSLYIILYNFWNCIFNLSHCLVFCCYNYRNSSVQWLIQLIDSLIQLLIKLLTYSRNFIDLWICLTYFLLCIYNFRNILDSLKLFWCKFSYQKFRKSISYLGIFSDDLNHLLEFSLILKGWNKNLFNELFRLSLFFTLILGNLLLILLHLIFSIL